MQFYTNPEQEDDPNSLPDAEVFYLVPEEMQSPDESGWLEPGYYWWSCFPGCLPDSEPIGPFQTQEEAMDDAVSCMEIPFQHYQTNSLL